jgi:hypothetical protein
MTKLPKFLTGKSHDRSEIPRRQPLRNAYRAMVARRADPHTEPLGRAIGDGSVDEEMAEAEIEGAPDVSVELPSQRRKKPDGENSADDSQPRDDRELSARPKTKLTPREELHRLYLSAVAGRSKPGDSPDAEADVDNERGRRAESRSEETRNEHAGRRANVPAVAIEENAHAEPAATRTTRIRKSDGTSVTVYHVGGAAQEAGQGAAQAEAAVEKAPASKPPAAARRRVTRESDRDGKFRDNPLR